MFALVGKVGGLRLQSYDYWSGTAYAPSPDNALRFDARQELNLLALREALADRRYEPGRSVCFFVQRPKLREVFAADFRDRVVHHVLVSHLERLWEPVFIHDSYACRKGKGVQQTRPDNWRRGKRRLPNSSRNASLCA